MKGMGKVNNKCGKTKLQENKEDKWKFYNLQLDLQK